MDGVEPSNWMSIAKLSGLTRNLISDFQHENGLPTTLELSARGAKHGIIYPSVSPRPRERHPGFRIRNPATGQPVCRLHGVTHIC